jgi:hypothetical protein
VPEVGLEPTRLTTGNFKSPMSTISSLGQNSQMSLRRGRELNPRMAVLQTAALPLRHHANYYIILFYLNFARFQFPREFRLTDAVHLLDFLFRLLTKILKRSCTRAPTSWVPKRSSSPAYGYFAD